MRYFLCLTNDILLSTDDMLYDTAVQSYADMASKITCWDCLKWVLALGGINGEIEEKLCRKEM